MFSQPNSFDDFGVIVRECGERTADACCALLVELLTGVPVHRVSGRPFAVTLRKSLELGLMLNRPWTLCVDADVLVTPGLLDFIAEARALPSNTFAAQALIIDKLLPTRRPAGNHLYRTGQIPVALSLIPSEDVLRPETEMIQRMRGLGHGFYQSRYVVGLHDFEQSLDDLFAKAYLHGHKHRSLKDDYLPIWQALAGTDQDYAVALAAWRQIGDEPVLPQVSRDHTDALMRGNGVAFKAKPALASFTLEDVVSRMKVVVASDPRIDQWRGHLQDMIDAVVFQAESAPESWLAGKYHRLRARWRAKGFRLSPHDARSRRP